MKNGMRLGILAGIMILVLVQVQIAHADENSWSTGGPYGTSVMGIAIHPTDTLRIYIGTVSSGIFQTTDGGANWSRIEDDTLDTIARSMRTIRIHPFGPDTMYVSTTDGIFKSTDAGQSWFQTPTPVLTNEYRSLEIHPDNPSMLFSAGWLRPIKSTDSGASWYYNNGGIGPMNIEEIKIDPINTNIVYFTGGHDCKSTDYGENWQTMDPDPFAYTVPVSLAVDPVDPRIIYLGRWDSDLVGTCLYKSTNGGDDWTDISPRQLVSGKAFISDVLVSPFDHNTVFIATKDNGIFRSSDGGQIWEEINEGLAIRKGWRIIIDPRGYLYLGLFHDGIYRSTNNGNSWQKISYNITGVYCTDIAANWRDPDTLYTATRAGLFKSTDGAESWERVILDVPYHQLIPNEVAVDPYDPSYVYLPLHTLLASTNDGAFYRSTDGGSTWDSFTAGLPSNTDYYSIAVADYGAESRRLFMGTSAGLYYSDDLGESWALCQGGLPVNRFEAIGVSPVNPDIVFVDNYPTGFIYKSTDGGDTWELLTISSQGRVCQIVCDPVDQDIVYVRKIGSGIFKSTDGGYSWDNINNNLPTSYVSGIAVNPDNHDNIFIYCMHKGFFQSHDGGQVWEDFYNESLRFGSIGYTLIDPVDTGRVFLAQYGQSVWEITRTPTSIDENGNENILPLALSASSYPNPFNPSATIEYSLPEEAFVTVEIYDLLGRKVETLVSAEQEPGSHRVVWDAKNRASGVYFYRIAAGESSDMKKMILLK